MQEDIPVTPEDRAEAQRVYSIVRKHLLTQMAQSKAMRYDSAGLEAGFACLYRDPEGLKCAAGVLIDDANYVRTLEHRSVMQTAVLKALEASGVKMVAGMLLLLRGLQRIHDHHIPWEWEGLLNKLAATFNLNPE